MRVWLSKSAAGAALLLCLGALAIGQEQQASPRDDVVATLVGRLELEGYKSTIKSLARFGDRRQGSQRNRDAVDWIESQLQAFGCTNTARVRYELPPRPLGDPPPPDAPRAGTPDNPADGTPTGGRIGRNRTGPGGAVVFGYRSHTTPNTDPMAQPNDALRELNLGPELAAPREDIYCTKIGTVHPDEVYIIGAHMDGRGFGEAANDDGSGTALVLELARIFNAPDVQTERSIRFALWNSEEGGLVGSRAYVEQRQALQGIEDPPGSGQYPEPKWLAMIQHDMMLFDHGAPGPDGRVSRDQRPEADVNIEFQTTADLAAEARELAWFFKAANEKYATDYPATVGPHMTNTDSSSFMNIVPAISLRENERGAQIGAGWDPHWHQPTDVFSTFTDDDFRLGLNAGQTTLAAIAQLAGARIE